MRPSLNPAFPLALAAALAVARAAEGPILFSDVTETAGLRAPLAGMMGHGAAWGDFDRDGRPDLFVGGFMDRPDAEYQPAPGPVPAMLFRNLGGLAFARETVPFLEAPARASGAVFADLDQDGVPELYIANNAKASAGKATGTRRDALTRHSLLLTRKDGAWFERGVLGACPSDLFTARNVGVLDFDADGLPDLFLVEDKFTPKPRSRLLRNLGGLRFEDATTAAGLPEDLHGLGLAIADVNDDRRPDLFVAHANRLFLGLPGGRIREATELAPVFRHAPFDAEDWPCGAAFGDLNRDGRPELVVTAHSTRARNRVFLHEGLDGDAPRYREITDEAGLGDIVPARCPHVEIRDFDNDGWPDIFTSAAWLDGDTVTPLIYRHEGLERGLPRFRPPRPIAGPMVYYPAGPSADADGDGRLDLFLVNWFQGNRCRLLRNESAPRAWLDVRLRGLRRDSEGLGARVRLYAAGHGDEPAHLLAHGEITTGYGYASGQVPSFHAGLGDADTVDVFVLAPDGTEIRRPGESTRRVLSLELP